MANRASKLFSIIDRNTVNMICDNIAAHYQITRLDACREVIQDDAEDILDYVTGTQRDATSVLLQKYGI